MKEIGLNHKPKRRPNGITKADKEARKSDDLLKRDFTAEKPLEKCITDMTEIKVSDGKLYVSAIFDCYDLAVLGLSMDTNMKATLCEQTLDNAYKTYPMLRRAILHSDRGTQYTSELYRKAIHKYGIRQSMNSAGGRCYDNARCESMWTRLKEEFLSLLSVIDSIKFHSSDYLDALEMGMEPQEESQYWVCSIIVEYMNDRLDKELLQYIQDNEGNGMQFLNEYYEK